jgi:RNA polymerase sigma-70 factor, ECF subfamily
LEKVGNKESWSVSNALSKGISDLSIGENAIDEEASSNCWRPQVIFGEPVAICGQLELELNEVAVAAQDELCTSREESQFIEALRAGDTVAFNSLVQERSSDIYALLYRLVEDVEEAQDLTQETFLQAYRNISTFRGEADLKTWLYRIAVNQARNRWRWWRRRRREVTVSLDDPTGDSDITYGMCIEYPSDSPEEQVLSREREALLSRALATLKRSFREVIVLRDIEGLSYEEVAETLQINMGTVKSRLARARTEMKRKLEGAL